MFDNYVQGHHECVSIVSYAHNIKTSCSNDTGFRLMNVFFL